MKTYAVKASDIQRSWYVVDADGQVLGRLASEIARVLRGKHKPIYTPHLDTGDFVVVVNAEKVRVTGAKESDKLYYRHSGYPGGLRAESVAQVRARFPERLIERAVKGMLPHNALGRQMYRKLKVYAGPSHPHASNGPKPLNIDARGEKVRVTFPESVTA
ncbi:MAG TPA: 50S ribosomal protein L13 [Chloroflexota bacterium]|nr:50S ribosomal protein L13 [Chloroflexota bacterium]